MIGIFGKKGVEHWIKKGDEYIHSGEFDKAIECLDRALERDPRNALAWNSEGFAYGELGDFKKCIECYDKSLEINPNYAIAWNNKGYVLTQLKKYGEALECFDKALEMHPYLLTSLDEKSKVHVKLEEYQKALDCYNQILAIDPDVYMIVMKRKAEALEKLGKLEEAKYWHEMATGRWGGGKGKFREANRLNNEAGEYNREGNFQKAIVCLNKALELDPKNVMIWSNKALYHLNLGEHREAIKASDKALEIAPNYVLALRAKGAALSYMHNFEDSLRCFERVLDILAESDPSFPVAWVDLERAAKNLWRKDEAKRYISKARELRLSKFGYEGSQALKIWKERQKLRLSKS